MVVQGIKQLVVTDHCMAVCCKEMGSFLMRYREMYRHKATVDLVVTFWGERLHKCVENVGLTRRNKGGDVEMREVRWAAELSSR